MLFTHRRVKIKTEVEVEFTEVCKPSIISLPVSPSGFCTGPTGRLEIPPRPAYELDTLITCSKAFSLMPNSLFQIL